MPQGKRYAGLSARQWLVAASIFVSLFVYFATRQTFNTLMFAFLLPMGAYGALSIHRSRQYAGSTLLRMLVAGLVWIALTTLLHRRAKTDWVVNFWFTGFCWLYLLFVPRDTSRDDLKLSFLSAGLVVLCGYMVFALPALYSVFTGRVVRFPFFEKPIGIQGPGQSALPIIILNQRNTEGRLACFCILVAIFGLVGVRRKWTKPLFALALLPSVMILAHSQSRTSYIGMGATLALLAFRGLYLKVNRRGWRWVAGLLAAALVFVGVLEGLDLVFKVDVRAARAIQSSARQAAQPAAGEGEQSPAAQPEAITSRVEADGRFDMLNTGRGAIWRGTLSFLKEHPRYLVTGIGGTAHSSYKVVTAKKTEIAHFAGYHNAFLLSLAVGGIPLLAAMVAFMCMMVGPCLRVFFRKGTEENRGLFLVPLWVFMQVITSLTETGIFLRASYANVLFCLMCGIVLHDDYLDRNRRLTRAPKEG